MKVGKIHAQQLDIFPGTQYFYHLWNNAGIDEVLNFEVLNHSMCDHKKHKFVSVLGPKAGKSTDIIREVSFASDRNTRFSVFWANIPHSRGSFDIEFRASGQFDPHRPKPVLTAYEFNKTSKHCSAAIFEYNKMLVYNYASENTVTYLAFPLRTQPKHGTDYTLALNALGSPNLKASFKYLPVCIHESENSVSHKQVSTSFQAFGHIGKQNERHTISVNLKNRGIKNKVAFYANTTDRFPDLTSAFSIFTYYKSKDGTCLLSSLNYLWQHVGHADSIITLPKASEVSFVLHSTRPNNMSAADAGFKIHVGLVQDCASFASSDCVLTGNSSLFVKLDSLSKSSQGKVVTHTCHQSRKTTVTVRRMNPWSGTKDFPWRYKHFKQPIFQAHLRVLNGDHQVHTATLDSSGASNEATFQLDEAAGETITVELLAGEHMTEPGIIFVNFTIHDADPHPFKTACKWILSIFIFAVVVYYGYQLVIYLIMKRELRIELEQKLNDDRVHNVRSWRYHDF
eukprot:146974_1